VGLFVGFEREWSRKDVGVRTFALTALLGTLSSLVSLEFSLVALGAVALVIVLVNGRALLQKQNLEITTSVSLMVDFVLGVLIGQGHVFTPVASALLLTLILSLKSELSSFAGGLRPEEIRSAVLLGLIGFVIYPLLPDRFIDPWKLINPRESWITVIVIAAIGFINYVLLRVYSDRGLLYTAVLGGLVNSGDNRGAGRLASRAIARDGAYRHIFSLCHGDRHVLEKPVSAGDIRSFGCRNCHPANHCHELLCGRVCLAFQRLVQSGS
jgi:hypothetical protein